MGQQEDGSKKGADEIVCPKFVQFNLPLTVRNMKASPHNVKPELCNAVCLFTLTSTSLLLG
jgi:hypothetical protein